MFKIKWLWSSWSRWPCCEHEVVAVGAAIQGGVLQGDVNLWPVEGAITRVELPLGVVGGTESVESIFKHTLSLVPLGHFAEELFWAGREVEFECESKRVIDEFEKVQGGGNFTFNLLTSAENVSVI